VLIARNGYQTPVWKSPMTSNKSEKGGTLNSSVAPLTGLTMIAVLAVLWGGNWPAMKLAVSEISPWTFRSICLVTGGIGLLAIARAAGHSVAIPRHSVVMLLTISLFNITLWHILSAYGLTLIEAGRAVIIAFTMPLWAVLLGHYILKDRLTTRRVIALILGLTGLVILIGPDLAALGAAPLGASFMLAAAFSWALGTVVMKTREWEMPILVLTGWQLFLGGIPVVIGMLLFEMPIDLTGVSISGLIGLAYAAIVATFVCHTLWFALVRVLPAAVAALGTLAIPIMGVFFSALFLGEQIGIREAIALCLVVAALATVLAFPMVGRSEARK
jgi:drug/metabolite transporter (DMT)-like permease